MEHLSGRGHCVRHWGDSCELDQVPALMQFPFQLEERNNKQLNKEMHEQVTSAVKEI